jgi:hypothetical protein
MHTVCVKFQSVVAVFGQKQRPVKISELRGLRQ